MTRAYCDVCGTTLRSVMDLIDHVNTEHPREADDEECARYMFENDDC